MKLVNKFHLNAIYFLYPPNISSPPSPDKEWNRIMSLTGAEDTEMLVAIRNGFRKGIPKSNREILNNNIIKAYDILKDIGGKNLVGEGKHLAKGTIWNAN